MLASLALVTLGFIVASGTLGRQCEAQRVASQPFRAGLRRRGCVSTPLLAFTVSALQPAPAVRRTLPRRPATPRWRTTCIRPRTRTALPRRLGRSGYCTRITSGTRRGAGRPANQRRPCGNQAVNSVILRIIADNFVNLNAIEQTQEWSQPRVDGVESTHHRACS